LQAIHQHLLIRATVSNAPKSSEVLNEWLTRLVGSIDMKVCIEPRSVYVSEPGNEGLTGQIGIETSHIAIHIWDYESPALVQMDVYSCRNFLEQTVRDAIGEWGLDSYESMMIDRSETFSVILPES